MDPVSIDTRWTDEMFLLMLEKLGQRKKRESDAMNPEKANRVKTPTRPITDVLAKAGFTIHRYKKQKSAQPNEAQ